MPDVVVLIPTKGRVQRLGEALRSVVVQTRLPDRLLVVGETSDDLPPPRERAEVASALAPRCVEWLTNERDPGMGGSLNSCLVRLLNDGLEPTSTIVALLDDDDTWDARYLEAAMAASESGCHQVVVSGLVRHESKNGPGRPLSVPEKVATHDFLVGNPHVQNSNLLVRLDTLLLAGGWDEALPSTQDRDLMIRVLDLGDVSVGFSQEHLVHYWALDHDRLSTRGSPTKEEGLRLFLRKYRHRMDDNELEAFTSRARRLFDVDPQKPHVVKGPGALAAMPAPAQPVDLVLGFTVSRSACGARLSNDIAEYLGPTGRVRAVVICDNLRGPGGLDEVVAPLRKGGIHCRVVTREDAEGDAASGRLTEYYVPPERRQGVAFGRTVLHRYLLKEASWHPGCAVWILDDDVRLNSVMWGSQTSALTAHELLGVLGHLREDGVAIAVGGICGDPPLPAAMTVRGQLLDLCESIRARQAPDSGHATIPTVAEDSSLSERFPEYHHDLSFRHHGHLEIPFGLSREAVPEGGATGEATYAKALARIIHGQSVSRPGLITAYLEEEALPTRGGNTIVFQADLLRAVPNLSPRLGSISTRRGDTLWCSILKRLGGALVGDKHPRVVGAPLCVRQERGDDPGNEFSWSTFVADALGRALTRALDSVLRRRPEDSTGCDLTALLSLSKAEIESVVASTQSLIERQVGDLRLNAWRVRGLCTIADRLLTARGDLEATGQARRLSTFYLEPRVDSTIETLRSTPLNDLRAFLRELPTHQREFARSLPPVPPDGWLEHQKSILETKWRPSPLTLVGRGDEGVVFTDGKIAIKYFFDGTAHLSQSQVGFLQRALTPAAGLRHIVPVRGVWRSGPHLALVTDLVSGSRFRGGHGAELFEFLREAKRGGFVVKNVSRDNLVSSEERVTYVDLGDDLVPFSDEGFRQMAKRVYLTFRWYFRSDLKQLLRASLTNEGLPELLGFSEFWDALYLDRVDALTDPLALSEIREQPHESVLDLGCGDGRLSRQVADMPAKVLGFDPGINDGKVDCSEGGTFHTIRRPELEERLANGPPFESVLCSMVLCEVPSEDEAEGVLTTAREALGEVGVALLSFCSPFPEPGLRSALWTTTDVDPHSYFDHHTRTKVLRQSGRIRVDRFRPISWYVAALHRSGLDLNGVREAGSVDLDSFLPSGEVVMLRALPLRRPRVTPVSLLIKTCPVEWRTIDIQVRHLVHQLEGPQRFAEKVVVADIHSGPFPRQYDQPDNAATLRVLENLRREGVVDRVVVPARTEADIRELNRSWFGVDSSSPSSNGGEGTYAFLRGLESCTQDLVLHADSDCLVGRLDRNHDYLGEMTTPFENDPSAITVAMTVARPGAIPYTTDGPRGPWRVESRLGLLSLGRLRRLLPLSNAVGEGERLSMSWYRSLDRSILEGRATSYRGGDPRTYFVHVPNSMKRPVNGWYNILRAIERGCRLSQQDGNVDLVGRASDWVGLRTEDLVFVVRGRDVTYPKLRRCVHSLLSQRDQGWGVVFVDGGSQNGMDEYLRYVVLPRFGRRASFLCNLEPLLPVQNIIAAVRDVCARPDSIIATLDADDALASPNVVDRVRAAHDHGADLTVGSMVRTDKESNYPVDLANPRSQRGGNVWQHLRTFRKSLFDRLTDDDLQVRGSWVPLADDWAYMVPMVELAQHPIFLEDKLYLYDPSPAHARRDRGLAESTISEILAKPSKKREIAA